jgi:hypothetical protein
MMDGGRFVLRALRVATIVIISACAAAPIALRAQEPSILSKMRVDPSKPIDFHALVSPETLFVGQQATYQVAVYLDEIARSRLRRNPEFLPPEMRGLLAYELGTPLSFPARTLSGKQYASHVFQKALFPLASGTLVVPSPRLSYSLPQSASYFSREESHVVEAESTTLVVKALPADGRPPDFSGAVGVLKSTVRLDTTTARVGDPLVLTLRVQGTGNVKLLPRPTLEIEWASLVPSTERLQVDTSGVLVKGVKEFDWILTPSREGAVTTPTINYSYFNPYTRKYEVAEAAPVTLTVKAGGLATPDAGEPSSTTVLALRDHAVGRVPLLPTHAWYWWALFGTMPLPATLIALAGRARAKAKIAPIESLRALVRKPAVAAASTESSTPARARISAAPTSARDVRRLFLASLARRLDVAPDVLHERSRTERILRRRGVTRETTRDLLTNLSELDVASFAVGNAAGHAAPNRGSATVGTLTAEAIALYERVDREALLPVSERKTPGKQGSGMPPTPVVLALFIMLTTGFAGTVSHAQPANDAWTHAVTAYTNRGFTDASEGFLRLAVASPRDADALANWGIASWAAGDTVSAVIAWQRAVRLDPMAADLREDLLLLPSGARDGIAEIPMVPVPLLTYTGFAAWSAGWVLLAWLAWRRRHGRSAMPAVRVAALSAVVLGVIGVGTALWGGRQLEGQRLSVVVRPETMRAGPGAEADALGGAATGDVVRIESQQPAWSRVLHADGREGWLPADHLAPITDGSP